MYEKKTKTSNNKHTPTGLTEQLPVNKSTFQLQDNRPQSIIQKKQVNDLKGERTIESPANITSKPVQRVKVNVERPGNSLSESIDSANSLSPIQAVSVTEYKSGTAISKHLLETAIREMTKIVKQAEKAHKEEKESGEDNFHSGPEHQRLLKIFEHDKVKEKLPTSSNSTFGLGGSNYFGNTPFTTTQGSSSFSQGIKNIPDIGRVENLGNRNTGLHDEMYHITEYPGLQALASSQGHCLFCYGTIHKRGYQHGSLRGSPWPSMWHHDYLGFGLKLTSANPDTIGFGGNPVIKIESDSFGSRYYYVTKI